MQQQFFFYKNTFFLCVTSEFYTKRYLFLIGRIVVSGLHGIDIAILQQVLIKYWLRSLGIDMN